MSRNLGSESVLTLRLAFPSPCLTNPRRSRDKCFFCATRRQCCSRFQQCYGPENTTDISLVRAIDGRQLERHILIHRVTICCGCRLRPPPFLTSPVDGIIA